MNGLNWVTIVGMGTPPAGGQGAQGGGMMMMGYMVIIFALFYFMMIRPQTKREKERRKMMEGLKAGDRVVFCGGMLGWVVAVKDQVLTVKVAENVKVEIARGAVVRVLEKDELPGDVEKQG